MEDVSFQQLITFFILCAYCKKHGVRDVGQQGLRGLRWLSLSLGLQVITKTLEKQGILARIRVRARIAVLLHSICRAESAAQGHSINQQRLYVGFQLFVTSVMKIRRMTKLVPELETLLHVSTPLLRISSNKLPMPDSLRSLGGCTCRQPSLPRDGVHHFHFG